MKQILVFLLMFLLMVMYIIMAHPEHFGNQTASGQLQSIFINLVMKKKLQFIKYFLQDLFRMVVMNY